MYTCFITFVMDMKTIRVLFFYFGTLRKNCTTDSTLIVIIFDFYLSQLISS